jgi:hypothetical protein
MEQRRLQDDAVYAQSIGDDGMILIEARHGASVGPILAPARPETAFQDG